MSAERTHVLSEEQIERQRSALTKLIAEIERNTCEHENTHRGGAIWTICDDCGRKWADDQGGFEPAQVNPAVIAAREALAALPSRQPADPDAGLGAQPWKLSPDGVTILDANGRTVSRAHQGSSADPRAVTRAQLAAPKVIKLARALIGPERCSTGAAWLLLNRLVPLAAEVIAIADGTEVGA